MSSAFTETPKNATFPSQGPAFAQSFGGDVAMAVLREIQSDLREMRSDLSEMRRDVTELKVGVTELRVDVKHLTTTTESIERRVEIVERKVEVMVNWKFAVFGGAAVLAVLWGIFKALAGYVHFGSMGG
jgi:hypothetical protein